MQLAERRRKTLLLTEHFLFLSRVGMGLREGKYPAKNNIILREGKHKPPLCHCRVSIMEQLADAVTIVLHPKFIGK